tara:strand:- start:151 stop:417 length:267 start_codon:yes stop_codon:yes gene_type:complete
MPRYIYKCEECDLVFQVVHSIKERLLNCDDCSTENSLTRIPSMPLVLTKKQNAEKREVGSLVREYIESAKEDLKEEVESMTNQVYEEE